MAYQLSLSDEPTKALLQCNLSLFFHLPSAILRLKTLQRIDNVCVMAVADGLQMVADATLICNHICNRAMYTKSRGYVDILAAVAEWQIKT